MNNALVSLLLAALLASVACQPKTGDIETEYVPGPRVVVIGDSITKSGRGWLHTELARTHASKIAGLAGSTYGSMMTYAEDYAPDRPEVAVLALGTNDRNTQWNLADSLGSLNRMYDLFEPSCTVGVTVATTASDDPAVNAKAAELNLAAQLRADTMVDWDAWDTEPGMTKPDRVHPTDDGYAWRAQLIAAAVDRCGDEPPVTTTTTTTTLPETTTTTEGPP